MLRIASEIALLQRIAPETTYTSTEDFSDGAADLFTGQQSGTWLVANSRYSGAPATGSDRAVSLLDLSAAAGLGAGQLVLSQSSMLQMEATFTADTLAGIVFDYYGPEDFKFAAVKADTNQVVIGHYTAKGLVIDATADQPIAALEDRLP